MAKSELRTKVAILRAAIGISAKEFAQLTGRSFHTQKALESGRLPLSESLAAKISKETGVALNWLLEESAKGPPINTDGTEMTPETFETRAAERAGEGIARDFLVDRFEDILKRAETHPNFDLCVWRVMRFLSQMESEFASPEERPMGIAESAIALKEGAKPEELVKAVKAAVSKLKQPSPHRGQRAYSA
jgi:transcriptional regulator with XRE-family HTH domain